MTHPETIDRFTIVRQVGVGGMGTVYEAIDPKIDRRVALKVLRRDMLAQNPELIERLWVEARAANSIRHSGVVQISEARLLDDGMGFLVMEFLDGQTLTQRLRSSGGRLSILQALQIAIQMASALSAGHQKGIIHRDVKPDNVMLVPDDAVSGGERVKLLDFGIAKIASMAGSAAPLTLNDMGLGTPGYMAPEQMRNAANASDRSDVYGHGAVLFEMLAGRRPLVAPNIAELIVMLLSQDPPLLTSLVDDAPPALVSLIARMLQREPASARPSTTEVLHDLVLISEMLTGHSPLRSGALQWVRQLPSEGPATPPTIAQIAIRPPKDASQTGNVLDPALSSQQPVSGPQPSSSTISQMTGQSGPSVLAAFTGHRRWLIPGITIGMLAFSLTGWWIQKAKQTTALRPPIKSVAEPYAPTQPPIAPPAVPTPKPPVDVQPAVPTQPASIVSHEPKPRRRTALDASCIQGAGLSTKAKRSIADVFSKAEVRLFPGEDIELIRQGNGLEVSSTPSSMSARTVTNIARMLQTALSKNDLPDGLKSVRVQCNVK